MTYPDTVDVAALAAIRVRELRDAEQCCADSFESYCAGSASASVLRDYAAGRVSHLVVPQPVRRREP